MKLIPILALLLLTSLPTYARLGETKAQCETRYGKPEGTLTTGIVVYKKADLNIAITFSKDKAVRIVFSKPDPKDTAKTLSLSVTECDTLLKANAGDAKWTEVPTSVDKATSWSLGDNKAMATYDTDTKNLNIVDMAYMMNPPPKEEEIKKLDGF